MFEFIRNGQQANRFVYTGTPGISNNVWYTFTKPPGINFISMVLIGGGGGGGAGRSGSNNQVARGGGGGGSAGGLTVATFLAATLPDVLYVNPGCGGAGGANTANSGQAGVNGNSSIVAVLPNLTNTALIIAAAPGGLGGNGAVALTVGPNTAQVAASNTTNMPLIDISLLYDTANGSIGYGGTANTATTNITPGLPAAASGPYYVIWGGAGGAGCSRTTSFLGSEYANTYYTSNVIASPIGNTTPSGSGVISMKPFMSIGGAGGSSNSSGTASAGGAGNIGAGGGGGGGGVIAGRGGNGGPGMVIITCY